MTDHPVTLTLPENLYEQARQVAEASAQAVEEVLLKRLEDSFDSPRSRLPLDEQRELNALRHLSDDLLWFILGEQMPQPKQDRMQILMDRNSRGTITTTEFEELSQLVEQGQRLILRKAQAGDILMDRGYKITLSDMSPQDE